MCWLLLSSSLSYFLFGCAGSFLLFCGLSLVAASSGLLSSCGVRASHCSGFSCCRAQVLDDWVSATVPHGPSCSVACGILLDQGSNLCALHWQADFQLLDHPGSPTDFLMTRLGLWIWGRKTTDIKYHFPYNISRVLLDEWSRSLITLSGVLDHLAGVVVSCFSILELFSPHTFPHWTLWK